MKLMGCGVFKLEISEYWSEIIGKQTKELMQYGIFRLHWEILGKQNSRINMLRDIKAKY